MNIKTAILTGDKREIAKEISEELKIGVLRRAVSWG